MSVKVYEINGEWLTWDHLHNVLGYTMTPSVAVSYKSAAHDTWGEDAGNGYVLNGNGELSRWSMWSEGIVGWFGANDLAEQGAYPASSANLFLERTGETAKAVSLDDGTNTYYLIDGYLDLGWRLWEVLEAEGWQISIDGELAYIVVDEETGTIVHSTVDEGLVYGEVSYTLMDAGPMILCLELTDDFGQFWLSASGRGSATDTVLRDNNKQYLRGEAGAITDDPDVIALYDQAPALAYIDVMGNIFSAASGDYAFKNERYPGSGYDLSLHTVATGSVRSAWSVLVKRPASEFTAYFTSSGSAYEYDTQINQGGGTNLHAASGATLYYDSSKTYTITGLYNAAGELLTFGDGDSLGDNSTYLFYNRGINLARVFAHHITYTET